MDALSQKCNTSSGIIHVEDCSRKIQFIAIGKVNKGPSTFSDLNIRKLFNLVTKVFKY